MWYCKRCFCVSSERIVIVILQTQTKTLQGSILKLQKQISSKDQTITQLSSTEIQLREELESIQQQVRSLEKDLSEHNSSKMELSKANEEDATQAVLALRDQLAKADQLNESLRLQVSDKTSELRLLREQHANEMEQWQTEQQVIQEELIAKHKGEMDAILQRIESLEQEKTAFEQERDHLLAKLGSVQEQLKQQQEEKELELSHVTKQIEEATIARFKEKQSKLLEEKENIVLELQQELEQLQKENKSLEANSALMTDEYTTKMQEVHENEAQQKTQIKGISSLGKRERHKKKRDMRIEKREEERKKRERCWYHMCDNI